MNLLEEARKHLSAFRFKHTEAVLNLSISLAQKYGIDTVRISQAAALHDIAKELPAAETDNYKKILNIDENISPGLVHAYISAYISEKKYNISDKEIINAIKYHSTGHKDFALPGLILFVSDYAEETRGFARNTKYIREIAYINIRMAAYLVVREKMIFVLMQGKKLDFNAVEFYNILK